MWHVHDFACFRFLFFILTELFFMSKHEIILSSVHESGQSLICNLVDPPASRTDTDAVSTSQENRTGQFETETHTKESPVEDAEDALNAINVVILCVFFTEVKCSLYYVAYWKIHRNFHATYVKPR